MMTKALNILLVLATLTLAFWLQLPASSEKNQFLQETKTTIWQELRPDPKAVTWPEQVLHYAGQMYDKNYFFPKASPHCQLIYFGYTYCPDICPMALFSLSEMYQKLSETTQKNLRVHFISLDPERDTPERLPDYLAFFHRDFIGLSAEATELRLLTKPLGVFYQKQANPFNPEQKDAYLLDHSTQILLFNAQGKRLGDFFPPHHPEKMAVDIEAACRK
jgi:protein SCO1/2